MHSLPHKAKKKRGRTLDFYDRDPAAPEPTPAAPSIRWQHPAPLVHADVTSALKVSYCHFYWLTMLHNGILPTPSWLHHPDCHFGTCYRGILPSFDLDGASKYGAAVLNCHHLGFLFMHPAPRLACPRCLGNPQVDHQTKGHKKMPQKKKEAGTTKRCAEPIQLLLPNFRFLSLRLTYVSQCRTQSDELPQWVGSSGSYAGCATITAQGPKKKE